MEEFLAITCGAGIELLPPPLRSRRAPQRARAGIVRAPRERVLALGIALATLLCLAVARDGHADMSGAWSGTLTLAARQAPGAIALALTQSGRSLTGTAAIQVSDPALDGSYTLQGRAKGRHLRLSGIGATGIRIVLRGVLRGARLTGRSRLRAPARKARGRIAVALQTTSGDPSACDPVLTQNEATFTALSEQVFEPVCAACHAAGGRASATRLRVTRGDALATARSVATVVDPTDPAASLLVTKPTQTLPHGGGLQVVPGSTQAELLLQWATLLRDAGCVPAAGSDAADAYGQHCASCHGADGSGLADAPDIRCAVRRILVGAVRSGRGSAMPSFGRAVLSRSDLRGMSADLAGRCSGEPQDVYAANCARCHGGNGGGSGRGPAIGCGELGSLRGVLASGEEGMPVFPSLAKRAGSLARWLRSICRPGAGD